MYVRPPGIKSESVGGWSSLRKQFAAKMSKAAVKKILVANMAAASTRMAPMDLVAILERDLSAVVAKAAMDALLAKLKTAFSVFIV